MMMFMIIVGAMLLTGGFALYIARNVEHGEARFDSKTGKVLDSKSSETDNSANNQ